MILRAVLFFSMILLLFMDLTFATTNNKKYPPMSFTRRRQFDETFRRLNRQCEQKETCHKYLSSISEHTDTPLQQHHKELAEIEMINCIRRCISLVCYREIYEKDPLERGEIDARTHLFRNCWIKEQKE